MPMTRIASALLVAAATLATTPAYAQSPEDFYRGKTINLVIPNEIGRASCRERV